MKTKPKRPLAFSCMLLVVLGVSLGLGLYQGRQLSLRSGELERLGRQHQALAEHLRQLERERDQATQLLADINRANAPLRSGQSLAELLRLRGQVGALRQELSGAEPYPNLIAHLLHDPAMKSDMQEQIRQSALDDFGALFKELKLTPEQTDQAARACADAALQIMGALSALPPGTARPEQIAQIGDQAQEALYGQLQPLLGESGLARFKELREELPARGAVNLLKSQLGAGQLSEDQSARLLQVVKAEPRDLTSGMVDGGDLAFWGTAQDIQDHLSKIRQSNEHILQQANSFLSPEQGAVLSTVLSNGINARIALAAAYIQKH